MPKRNKPQLWSVTVRLIIYADSQSNTIIKDNVFLIKISIKNQQSIVKAKLQIHAVE